LVFVIIHWVVDTVPIPVLENQWLAVFEPEPISRRKR
jgi:hypothetical protein